MNYYLMKLAEQLVNPSRRLLGMAIAGKMIPKTGNALTTAAKSMEQGLSFGTPATGMGKMMGTANKVNNMNINIAKIRNYRMERVKGASRAQAAGDTFVKSTGTKYIGAKKVALENAKSIDTLKNPKTKSKGVSGIAKAVSGRGKAIVDLGLRAMRMM